MLGTQKTYQEHLQEVRAKQFGWVQEEPTPLDESVAKAVVKEKPKAKKTAKNKKTEEAE